MKQKIVKLFVMFLTLLMISNLTVTGQGDPSTIDHHLNNVIPPSPTAASLGKFGDIPVSLYTGTPQVSIPIWNIKTNELSLPISLSYHASGVKVEEIPGWVGLGWSLSAGGVITRTVREKYDECLNYGYLDYCQNGVPTNPSCMELRQILGIDKKYDTEPDLFNFNFAGRSGQFVIDPNNGRAFTSNNIHIMPHQLLKIEPILGTGSEQYIKGFIITDEMGTTYHFTEPELMHSISTPVYSGSALNNDVVEQIYNSSWYLSKIVSANQTDEIVLEYQEKEIEYERSISETITEGYGVVNETDVSYTASKSVVNTKVLDKISFSTGKIEFRSSDDRLDLFNNYGTRLDTILIYPSNNCGSCTPSAIRKFIFDYSYITSGPAEVSFEKIYHRYRLRLDKIRECGAEGSNLEKPPYVFDYNNIPLPSRASNDKDYWGYYNHADNGDSEVPELTYQGISYQGANRKVNINYVQAGILEQITYPTGGYTLFEYEPHDYNFINHTELNPPENGYYTNNRKLTYRYYAGQDSVVKTSPPFKIDYAQDITCETVIETNPSGIKIGIKEVDGDVFPIASFSGTGTHTVHLDSGLYFIEFIPCIEVDCAPITNNATLELTYEFKSTTGATKNYAGGVRIKRITDHGNTDTQKNIVREYEYCLISDSLRSSGVLVNQVPDYHYLQIDEQGGITKVIRTSGIQGEVCTSQGSHIGYRNVTVYEGGKIDNTSRGKNGKTVYEYTSAYEYPGMYGIIQQFPYPPVIAKDWKRGMLLKKSTMNKSNALVQEEINTYHEIESNTQIVDGLKVAYIYKNPEYLEVQQNVYDDLICQWNVVDYTYYTYPFTTSVKKSTIQKIWNTDGTGDPVITKTEYAYDPLYLQLKQETNIINDNEKIMTRYKYPTDSKYSGQAIYQNMINKGMLNVGIEQAVLSSNFPDIDTLNCVKTNYQQDGNRILKESIEQYEKGKGMQTRLTFDKYNFKGNVLQLTKTGSNPVSLIWGYSYNLPVIKMVNTSYSEAENILAPIEIARINDSYVNSTYEEMIKEKAGLLRDNLPNAIVTTHLTDMLIGPKETIDPNKMATCYEYDALGRLKSVKNKDYKTMKTYPVKDYEYHYLLSNKQPQSKNTCLNNYVTFSVEFFSVSTYQWQKSSDEGTTYVDITDAINPDYTVKATSENNGNYYRCVMDQTLISGAAQLNLISAPQITLHPTVNTICMGGMASFSVAATGNYLKYQWQKADAINGVYKDKPCAFLPDYSFTTYSKSDEGYYRCRINNDCDTIYSTTVGLTIIDDPTITSHPQDALTCNGTVTFNVAANGYNPSYQWYRKRVTSAETEPVGPNDDTYSFTPGSSDHVGDEYWCVVTNTGLCDGHPATSNKAKFLGTQYPSAPTINGTTVFYPQQTVTYSVANPNSTYTYRWSLQGSYQPSSINLPIPYEGTSITFTFGIEETVGCDITVTAIDACGNEKSTTILAR